MLDGPANTFFLYFKTLLVACKSHVLSRQKSVLQTHTESFAKIVHYHEYTCMQMFTETNKKLMRIINVLTI